MVGFKNRYTTLEVVLDPNKELAKKDPVIITTYNVTKAIKYSILVNFGECGLASSLGSFQVKYVNEITGLCIIRASREDHRKEVSGLAKPQLLSVKNQNLSSTNLLWDLIFQLNILKRFSSVWTESEALTTESFTGYDDILNLHGFFEPHWLLVISPLEVA